MITTQDPATYQVTEWGHEDETVTANIDGYAQTMTYGHWLSHEVNRWNDKIERRDCWVVECQNTGRVALFAWSGHYKAVSVDVEDGK